MFSAKTNSLHLTKVTGPGDRLEGPVDLAAWSRLAAAMAEVKSVQADLDLQRNGSVVLADGFIEVSGQIRCERCLGNMPLSLKVPVHSGLAETEEMVSTLDPDLDIVLADRGVVALQVWLEDEVLLALPMIPRCAEWQSGTCPVSGLEAFIIVD